MLSQQPSQTGAVPSPVVSPTPLQVPDGTAPDRLAQEVVSRAAAKVQRLLHYRSLPGAACRRQSHGSSAAAAGVSSADGSEAAASAAGTGEAALLLERRLLSEVEAARERCKREAILARLQSELPSCQVVGCLQDFGVSQWLFGQSRCPAMRSRLQWCTAHLL